MEYSTLVITGPGWGWGVSILSKCGTIESTYILYDFGRISETVSILAEMRVLLKQVGLKVFIVMFGIMTHYTRWTKTISWQKRSSSKCSLTGEAEWVKFISVFECRAQISLWFERTGLA